MQIDAVAKQAYLNFSTFSSDNQSNKIIENKKPDSIVQGKKKEDGFMGDCPACQCEKCRTRRYQDGSNDSRVSFQMPTVMDPVKAKVRVMSHETEHVRSEQHKAKKENKVVISQTVRILNDRCDECGRNYVKGGFTKTITRPSLVEFRKVVSGTLKKDGGKKLIGIA